MYPVSKDPEDLRCRMQDADSGYEHQRKQLRREEKMIKVMFKNPGDGDGTKKPPMNLSKMSLEDMRKMETAKRMALLRDRLSDTRKNVAWKKKIAAKKPAAPPAFTRIHMGMRHPEPLLIDPDAYQGGPAGRSRGLGHQQPLKVDNLLRTQKPRLLRRQGCPTVDEIRRDVAEYEREAKMLLQELRQIKDKRLRHERNCETLQEVLRSLAEGAGTRALVVDRVLPYSCIPGMPPVPTAKGAGAMSAVSLAQSQHPAMVEIAGGRGDGSVACRSREEPEKALLGAEGKKADDDRYKTSKGTTSSDEQKLSKKTPSGKIAGLDSFLTDADIATIDGLLAEAQRKMRTVGAAVGDLQEEEERDLGEVLEFLTRRNSIVADELDEQNDIGIATGEKKSGTLSPSKSPSRQEQRSRSGSPTKKPEFPKELELRDGSRVLITGVDPGSPYKKVNPSTGKPYGETPRKIEADPPIALVSAGAASASAGTYPQSSQQLLMSSGTAQTQYLPQAVAAGSSYATHPVSAGALVPPLPLSMQNPSAAGATGLVVGQSGSGSQFYGYRSTATASGPLAATTASGVPLYQQQPQAGVTGSAFHPALSSTVPSIGSGAMAQALGTTPAVNSGTLGQQPGSLHVTQGGNLTQMSSVVAMPMQRGLGFQSGGVQPAHAGAVGAGAVVSPPVPNLPLAAPSTPTATVPGVSAGASATQIIDRVAAGTATVFSTAYQGPQSNSALMASASRAGVPAVSVNGVSVTSLAQAGSTTAAAALNRPAVSTASSSQMLGQPANSFLSSAPTAAARNDAVIDSLLGLGRGSTLATNITTGVHNAAAPVGMAGGPVLRSGSLATSASAAPVSSVSSSSTGGQMSRNVGLPIPQSTPISGHAYPQSGPGGANVLSPMAQAAVPYTATIPNFGSSSAQSKSNPISGNIRYI
ncbi:unnamed protein product [Amoebophrya sp. A25]|nr:unnamed protein product [Amoebophrya sp. A25]|eukprot:GSA25T00015233001.1